MAWQETQAALGLLKTPWPRRTSPAGSQAAKNHRLIGFEVVAQKCEFLVYEGHGSIGQSRLSLEANQGGVVAIGADVFQCQEKPWRPLLGPIQSARGRHGLHG